MLLGPTPDSNKWNELSGELGQHAKPRKSSFMAAWAPEMLRSSREEQGEERRTNRHRDKQFTSRASSTATVGFSLKSFLEPVV